MWLVTNVTCDQCDLWLLWQVTNVTCYHCYLWLMWHMTNVTIVTDVMINVTCDYCYFHLFDQILEILWLFRKFRNDFCTLCKAFFFLGEKVSPTLINQGLQNRASHGQHFVSGLRRDQRKFLEKFCYVLNQWSWWGQCWRDWFATPCLDSLWWFRGLWPLRLRGCRWGIRHRGSGISRISKPNWKGGRGRPRFLRLRFWGRRPRRLQQ